MDFAPRIGRITSGTVIVKFRQIQSMINCDSAIVNGSTVLLRAIRENEFVQKLESNKSQCHFAVVISME
jgi:hypothetical protein